jgi:ankyrin repeat protein
MISKGRNGARPRTALWALLEAVAAGDRDAVRRILRSAPHLAREASAVGATRASATPFRLEPTGPLIYVGDTALHVAAAIYNEGIAADLVAHGADVRARNRRGAEPLHMAAVGVPGSLQWNPTAQSAVINYLVSMGADPNATDMNGVTPLHRAVRTRCSAAVVTLLATGADPNRPNGKGSTPLHLAIHNTGRGGSGTPAAKREQATIIKRLIAHPQHP